jgi:hypothetical protein
MYLIDKIIFVNQISPFWDKDLSKEKFKFWIFPKICHSFPLGPELERGKKMARWKGTFCVTKLKILDRIWRNSNSKPS